MPSQAEEKITVALVQDRVVEDPSENLTRTLERIGQAASRGADVVCLQELFMGPYFCRKEEAKNFDLAQTIPGPASKALSDAAREHGVAVVASLFEKRAQGLYHNTALILDRDGQTAGMYRKMHIPDDPGYFEKYYFAPGDLGFKTHKTAYGDLGVLVCWDQWYPEAARLTALQGAWILIYPTAIGKVPEDSEETAEDQRQAWETIQRSHAISNGVFVASVNRVGQEGELGFWGSSFVCDPMGKVLGRASKDREEILVVSCDTSLVEETRRSWPFLRDRRVDAYQGLTERFLDRPDA